MLQFQLTLSLDCAILSQSKDAARNAVLRPQNCWWLNENIRRRRTFYFEIIFDELSR